MSTTGLSETSAAAENKDYDYDASGTNFDSTAFEQHAYFSPESNNFDTAEIKWTMQPIDDGVTGQETSTYYYDDCEFFNETTNQTEYNPECYYTEEEGYFLEIYPFEIIVLGYIQPALILLTTITNVFVVGFFMSKKNRGKATSLLFVSIAFSDTLTGLTLISNSIGVYAANYTNLTIERCNIYMLLRFYVSPVFHTVSVWQTVVLCVQRYFCVCHPFISGRVCTFWKTFVSIVIMYCGAIVMHTYHLTDNKVGSSRCRWVTEKPCVVSCMYLWFCVVLQHLLPCIVLVSLTVVTLRKLQKAQKRVSIMSFQGHLRKNSNRSTRDRIITITATMIVVCFLIPELPHGIYKLVFVMNKHMDMHLLPRVNHIIICVYEIALIVSFNANFWIYCAMMHDFRYKLLKCLTCGAFKKGLKRLRLLSVSSTKSTLVTSVSRTSSSASRNRVLSRTISGHSTTSENLHVVCPLTPTKAFDKTTYAEKSTEPPEPETNDDVFV